MNATISKAKNTDFELEQFANELYHEINSLAYSDDDGASKENKFTEYIMEFLGEAGETEGIRLCPYFRENKNENIEIKINGYALEEGLESVDLFITHYEDINEIYRLYTADFENLLKWSTKFLNGSLKGHLEDIEQSSEAYGLARLIRDNKNGFIRVNIFILSNGNIPFDAPKNTKIKGFEDIQINVHIWDLERLHRLSQSKYNREPIEINFKETLGVTIPCLEMPSTNELYECYLAIISGQTLATLYKNYGTRLLESNVRAFLQQTGKVNRGIRDTIKNDPHLFLPYNNGLASTAIDVETELINGQKVITTVKDFQIVNGGQTTASLFHTFKKFKADLSEVFVQMKLTVIKDEDKKNEMVPYISRYANSQNKVSELDLTSNNPFLQKLEELSRTTYAIDLNDRSKQTIWYFERVQGQYREALNKEPTKGKQDAFKLKYPTNQKLIKADVAKAMNIFKLMPYHVSKGAQKNYNVFLAEAEKEYKKNKPTRVLWEDVVANTILFRTTDKLFGRKNQNPIGDTNIKSHTVAYTLSLLHKITNNKINLGKIWENQCIDPELEHELKNGLVYVYKFFTSLNVLLISEAAKAEKTWTLLVDQKEHPFDLGILKKYCSSDSELKKRYDNNIDNVAESKRYNELQKIVELGIRFWDGLYTYNIRTKILTKYEDNIVSNIRSKIKRSGNFTDSEIKNGILIIEKLKKLNINNDELSALSKVDEKIIIDPSTIYNRLLLIETAKWNQIIALGEQTGNLTFKEISVIKTVIQKIKRKENIDLNRLEIVDSAIKKLSKYGIKI
ncbi:AIPR family protein [Arenibacter sp. 6A1]|uniref:AIPR family protein n=1 Tax=Arenibacter sp. 6A1 TaxID=2720391 RepID=UPI00144539F3|nr:AIPR family protein [Arenibacter sp. 6A1]NKI26636.1 AIPR family protein [Arenibacter sp. 6A1]